MLQKIVFAQGTFEMAAGPFTVEFRVYLSAVFGFVSIKVAPQSKSYRAVTTTVWFRVGITMATEKEAVSLADKFTLERGNTYTVRAKQNI